MGDLHNVLTRRALQFGATLLLTATGALAQTQQPAPPAPDQDPTPHAWRKAADVPEMPELSRQRYPFSRFS